MIEQCVGTISTCIMLNGSPGDVFSPQRGLRQGYPLSPYLFILCMKTFSRSLLQAEHNNLIHYIKINEYCPAISHLFFADDCLIFAKAYNKEARNLMNIIDKFSTFSGQSINYQKSGIAFSKGVPNQLKNEISNILNIKKLAINDNYLGVPLLLQRNKTQSFRPLLDMGIKIIKKYVVWDVGDGSDIQIWKHIWIPSISSNVPSHFSSTNMITVSQLIDDDTKSWNLQTLNALFDNHTVNAIISIRIPFSGKDCLRWIVWSSANPSLMSTISNVVSFQDWIISLFQVSNTTNNDIVLQLSAFIMWHIWKCRCKKVFEAYQETQSEVVYLIKSEYSTWNNFLSTNSTPVVSNIRPAMSRWKKPDNPYMKINWDAAFDEVTKNVGIGLISRSFAGVTDGARYCRDKALDPEQAEAKAQLDAALWGGSKGYQNVHLEGVCLNVVNALNGSLD
ncbi:uncharacterized protein LOC113351597 [Papaver somniferum]|uniref:uncharacterized protein LOC113351597 n=1 Tax=Papaver somniferum TaxID=3469 RepID=UPI000E70321A|nr:uncharacterized protein LOC113351597 [Papaver somniferum]